MSKADDRVAQLGWGCIITALLIALGIGLCSARAHGQPQGYALYGERCAEIQISVFGPYWTSLQLAQVQVESGWRPDVCSPYACGLTQFTPQTEAALERQLGVSGDIFDPEHACLLQAHLLKVLAQKYARRMQGFRAQWAYVFSAYNGSPATLDREWRACGRPPNTVALEPCCRRRAAHCRENHSYWRKIFTLWPRYLSFGWPT